MTKYPATPLSRTLIERTVKYLDDAARLYDSISGQRAVCRAWCIRQLIAELQRRQEKAATT